MATNQFFNSSYFATDADQQLLQDLTTESVQINGIDVQYLPREFVNLDELFGEDQSSSFSNVYTIEVYLKSFDGFGGDGKFLEKFGLEIRDEMTFSVSRPRFTEEVTENEPDLIKPREGDLLMIPSIVDKRNRLFEITYVEGEEAYYQLGNLYTWEIRTKVFELGGETFDTGIDEIDSIGIDFDVQRDLILSSVSGVFVENENVVSSTGSAEITAVNGTRLSVRNIVGDLTTGQPVNGQASGASAVIESVVKVNGETNIYSDNDKIDDESADFIDFTEKNPFSE